MLGRPQPNEAVPYYSTYIDLIGSDDILIVLEQQLDETLLILNGISEEKSLHRYAPDKWSLRDVLGHINDGERLFVFRALWFARGFDSPLPSFDQEVSVRGAQADKLAWADLVDEFRSIRLSTLTFFKGLPAEAWSRSGIASDNPFTVRALAYIAAGHLAHHTKIIQEKYL